MNLEDPRWRLENLYYIIDKSGRQRLFKLNWAQERLYEDVWYCNIILKARQLGVSTFICLLFLDRCLFNDNKAAGIIAHTREDAEYLFRRIKYAYDKLPDKVKQNIPAKNDSARELAFANGSSIRVGTSMRGSTFQYLHISEFGKICAKYPEKAKEIITGSLNTVAPGQFVFIESTAEGKEGYFYEMCKQAETNHKAGKDLNQLEYRFHFFPWWQEPSYRIGSQVVFTQDSLEYFDSIKIRGIDLDDEQKYWYALTHSIQKENMLREYPTTPDEAWESAIDGTYYAKYMSLARLEKRIGFIPYEPDLPVHTAWDLGYNDSTAIWFFQVFRKEIRLIDYVEGAGESLAHWLGVVKSKPYVYEKHIGPHDILVHEYTSGMTRQSAARKMGINLIPAQKVEVLSGIDQVRNLLGRCFFDENKCAQGIKALENYRKDWNDKMGCWSKKPRHDQFSHGCFIGETLIECKDGAKPIKFIQEGDFVKTPAGYRRVLHKFEYEAHNLLTVTQENCSVTCTNNHKIFSSKGLVRADALRYNDYIYMRKDEKYLCQKYGFHGKDIKLGFRDYFLSATMNLHAFSRDTLLHGTDFITEEIQAPNYFLFQLFNELCGLTSMEKYLPVVISTIKTVIEKITTLTTWNVSQLQSMVNLALSQMLGWDPRLINNSYETIKTSQKNGTKVDRAWSGIDSMELNLGKKEREQKRSANYVAPLISRLGRVDLSTVATNARQKNVFLAVLMKWIENVSFAIPSFASTVTTSQKPALKFVPHSFKNAQKVFDIEVEFDHCYYANGLLVSNSDAFRYLATGLHYIQDGIPSQVKTLGNLRPHSMQSIFG